MQSNNYISGLKKGDRKIISEIYANHLPQLSSWVVKNNGSEDDALDIFQEGIESIIKKIYNNTLPLDLNFGGYLFTICKNKWKDRLKEKIKDEKVRNEQLVRYDNVEEDLVSIDEDKNSILQSMLDETYQTLSPTCQKLVSLLESGLTPKEVAAELNMTNANTVYRRKFACYESWKKQIKSHKHYAEWSH